MHPKAKEVEKMLMNAKRVKEIIAELKVCWRVVHRQRRRIGMKLIWATDEERWAIADKRGIDRRSVS
jgi:hypothetical protein